MFLVFDRNLLKSAQTLFIWPIWVFALNLTCIGIINILDFNNFINQKLKDLFSIFSFLGSFD